MATHFGTKRAGIGDDQRREDLAAVGLHPHPHRAPVFDEDLVDGGVDEHGAPGLGDRGDEGMEQGEACINEVQRKTN